MNKSCLRAMIFVLGLQSIIMVPSPNLNNENDEVQGVVVDPEHDEGLIDQTDQQEEDRTTQIELNAPLLGVKVISDNRLVEVVEAIVGLSVVFFVVYKVCWANNNDSNK